MKDEKYELRKRIISQGHSKLRDEKAHSGELRIEAQAQAGSFDSQGNVSENRKVWLRIGISPKPGDQYNDLTELQAGLSLEQARSLAQWLIYEANWAEKIPV